MSDGATRREWRSIWRDLPRLGESLATHGGIHLYTDATVGRSTVLKAVAVEATGTCTFTRDERGFIYAVMKPGCVMELADAQENLAATFEAAGRKPTRVLVDMRGVRAQSREARQYFGGPEAEQVTRAVALVVGSPVSRVLANFFLRLHPGRIPTALFTSEAAAIGWLEGFDG